MADKPVKKGLRGRRKKIESNEPSASPDKNSDKPSKKSSSADANSKGPQPARRFKAEYLMVFVALVVGLLIGTIKRHFAGSIDQSSTLLLDTVQTESTKKIPVDQKSTSKTKETIEATKARSSHTVATQTEPRSSAVASRNRWIQKGSTIVGPHNRSRFGFAVQIVDDSFLIVGIPGFQNETGALQAYEFKESELQDAVTIDWIPMGQMLIGEDKGNEFGRSLSYDDKLVVGGMTRTNAYQYKEGLWHLVTSLEGEKKTDGFGFQVGYRNGKLMASAPGVDVHRGAVETIVNGKSIQIVKGHKQKDQSGASLAVSQDGTTMAIGSPMHSPPGLTRVGQVRIFEWKMPTGEEGALVGIESGEWVQKGEALVGDASEDWFGQSVAVSADGSVVACGSPGKDTERQGQDFGAVTAYEYDQKQKKWVARGKELEGKEKGDEFGFAVSLSADGNLLAASAIWNDDVDSRSGHVRVFAYNGFEWAKVGEDLQGEQGGDWFGNSVSLSADGKYLAAGAICRNNGWQGFVKVFQFV